MNQQEIFEKVARHLLAQGMPAKNEFGRCQYRTTSGMKCAVGCLIPEELYSSSMEDLGVGSPELQPVMEFLQVNAKSRDMELLGDLQMIHDCIPVEEWKKKLQHKAEEFGLTFPEDLT